MNKKSFFAFLRARIAALIGTSIDDSLFFGLKELAGVWYIYANIVGAIMGAISNYLLGRYWAFNEQTEEVHKQAGKYFLVSFGSLLLNTSGLYMLTEWTQLNANLSKVIVGILVAVCFNFLLQKHFVFKKSSASSK